MDLGIVTMAVSPQPVKITGRNDKDRWRSAELLRYGRRGRGFESLSPPHKIMEAIAQLVEHENLSVR